MLAVAPARPGGHGPAPMRSSSRPRSLWWCAALAALGASLTGCGHPATREECDQLLTKIAEIELRSGQNVSDPKTIEERTSAARAMPKGVEFTSQCVGKRITTSALECVRKATTPEQFDRCL
jgi:hypothetical protein